MAVTAETCTSSAIPGSSRWWLRVVLGAFDSKPQPEAVDGVTASSGHLRNVLDVLKRPVRTTDA